MPKDDLTIQEVAERLGAAPRTVNKWIERGLFPGAYQVNPRLWMIPKSDVDNFKRPRMGAPKRKTEDPTEGSSADESETIS